MSTDVDEMPEVADRPVNLGMAAAVATASLSACLENADLALPQSAHFLGQATLGSTWGELEALDASTLQQWLEAQFAMPRAQSHFDGLMDYANKAAAINEAIGTLTLQIEEVTRLIAQGQATPQELAALEAELARQEALSRDYSAVAIVADETMAYHALWRRFITGKDQLRQRMMLALSEILVVSGEGLGVPFLPAFYLAGYMDLLESHAFGNFRDLLEAVTLNPAMGYYLSHRGNLKADPATGRVPDENYAREILQLFSIGLVELNVDGTPKLDGQTPIDTYAQEDIVGLAKVFTGWEIEDRSTLKPSNAQRLPMKHYPDGHSLDEKRFLGVTIAAGTDGPTSLQVALDTIFNHPNVGPFIGRQLIQKLVSSNPTPSYVSRVAQVFNNNGQGVRGDLRAVLRAILIDVEARVPLSGRANQVGKLREPVVRFVQWARAFKAYSPSGQFRRMSLSDPATSLGQQPMRSPSVFNFFRPGYVPPNTEIAAQGLIAPEFQLLNETSAVGYINFMHQVIVDGLYDLRADYTEWLPLADTPDALVTRLNLLLAAGRLDASVEQRITQALASIPALDDQGRTRRVQAACLLVMSSPTYLIQP